MAKIPQPNYTMPVEGFKFKTSVKVIGDTSAKKLYLDEAKTTEVKKEQLIDWFLRIDIVVVIGNEQTKITSLDASTGKCYAVKAATTAGVYEFTVAE